MNHRRLMSVAGCVLLALGSSCTREKTTPAPAISTAQTINDAQTAQKDGKTEVTFVAMVTSVQNEDTSRRHLAFRVRDDNGNPALIRCNTGEKFPGKQAYIRLTGQFATVTGDIPEFEQTQPMEVLTTSPYAPLRQGSLKQSFLESSSVPGRVIPTVTGVLGVIIVGGLALLLAKRKRVDWDFSLETLDDEALDVPLLTLSGWSFQPIEGLRNKAPIRIWNAGEDGWVHFGQSPDMKTTRPTVSLQIAHPSLSRNHGRLQPGAQGVRFKLNTHNTNPTRVNGVPVTRGEGIIGPGDRFEVGGLSLMLMYDGSEIPLPPFPEEMERPYSPQFFSDQADAEEFDTSSLETEDPGDDTPWSRPAHPVSSELPPLYRTTEPPFAVDNYD